MFFYLETFLKSYFSFPYWIDTKPYTILDGKVVSNNLPRSTMPANTPVFNREYKGESLDALYESYYSFND